MWRTNTDSIQQWGRLTEQIESFVGQGVVSKPGAWAFGDCLELGIEGLGVLTWEESKSHVALWSVCSQPLFLGNDMREGHVQQRLIDLMVNTDMLMVNQQWAGNAGDRLWTGAMGQEVWGKPLPNHTVAVVVVNRDGLPMVRAPGDCGGGGWASADWCGACNAQNPIDAPCDDNATASIGAQTITLDFSFVPAAWLLSPAGLGASKATAGVLECEVFDIFATAKHGQTLGRMKGSFVAEELPPHGSKFLLLRKCRQAGMTTKGS